MGIGVALRRRAGWSSACVHRPRLRRRLVLVQRQARGQGRRRRSRSAEQQAPRALRDRRASSPSAPACRCPQIYISPDAAAQRVRDRPQPEPRRGRGHAGPPAGRSTATSCAACSPTSCRHVRQPRHPHRLGRRGRRDGHHVRRPHGDVGCDVRRWRRATRDGNIFGVLAMAILAPIAAALLQMALVAVARVRGRPPAAPTLLGDGEPLARALEKIEAYAKQVPMNIDPAQATAYIINPLTRPQGATSPTCSRTHPPTGRAHRPPAPPATSARTSRTWRR